MSEFAPTNSLVNPLLTDMYQISMAYAYWKNGKSEDPSVFDLFFRKNPFEGEFCIFAGIDEVVKFLASFKFTDSDIEYLQTIMPTCEKEFFDWLSRLDCKSLKVYAMQNGLIVFPKEPLLRVEGPLALAQLVETTLLNLINYPSLVATNAARMKLAAGPGKTLIEFGLRRAQGPDGGLSASKYSYLGGFSSTANVLAGKLFGIAVKGTHAHAFVMCYSSIKELKSTKIKSFKNPGSEEEFLDLVLQCRHKLGYLDTNEGELAAFIAYAQSFPTNFLALVDTYETITSGVKNFISVGYALHLLGYKPIGVRLDSGDLAYLSKTIREVFKNVDSDLSLDNLFTKCTIVASNDINEDVLLALNREEHEIDVFGVGTHLVTCQKQPALGCVYKLVEINGQPRIKLSQESEKMIIPGKKNSYRLYGEHGFPLLDILLEFNEEPPRVGQRILVRHPFAENKRAYVTPTKVEPLLSLVFDGSQSPPFKFTSQMLPSSLHDVNLKPINELECARTFCIHQLIHMRNDHIRPLNPTPYKISVSQYLYDYTHNLWMSELPVAELK